MTDIHATRDSAGSRTITIPARTGLALTVPAGAGITVTNPHGSQVADVWALCSAAHGVHLSMEHTRAVLSRLVPRTGDTLYDSLRQPMLTLAEDTSPGVHDTLIAACDANRYRLLGYEGYHASCADNFWMALGALDIHREAIPAPLNLFMNITWTAEGELGFEAPVSRPGDAVTLIAEQDLVFVISACPQDLVPVNGAGQLPRELEVTVNPNR